MLDSGSTESRQAIKWILISIPDLGGISNAGRINMRADDHVFEVGLGQQRREKQTVGVRQAVLGDQGLVCDESVAPAAITYNHDILFVYHGKCKAVIKQCITSSLQNRVFVGGCTYGTPLCNDAQPMTYVKRRVSVVDHRLVGVCRISPQSIIDTQPVAYSGIEDQGTQAYCSNWAGNNNPYFLEHIKQ